MYNSIFDVSIFISIANSIFFILINLSLANNLDNFLSKKKIFNNFDYSFLLSFYLIFLIDCVIYNLLILIKSKIFIFYFYYILKIICFIIFFRKISIKFQLNKINAEYKLVLLIFLIIAFLPVTDADSIAIHLNFPISYISNLINLNEPLKYAELSLYFNSEVLLINSILFKSSNLGNLLNFVSLSIFLISSIKNLKKNNFLLLFFSMPLILFLLNTQKLQLFFAILYLVIFIYFNDKSKREINNPSILTLSFLVIFYVSGKLSYVLLSIPLVIFIIFKLRNFILFKYLFIASFILLFPVLLNKYFLFGDPLSPFLSNFLNVDIEYKNLLNTISKQGWKAEGFNLFELFQFIIPWKISYISTATGLGFLYILYKNFLNKFKYYFIVSCTGIFLIYLSGQIGVRFYLESILLLFWFSKFKINKVIQYFLKFQLLLILIISALFLFFSISHLSKSTENFLEKFSYTFLNAKKINNLNIKDNILLLDQGRDSIFYNKNIFTFRIRNNEKYLISSILENKINYIVTDNIKKIPKCINYKYIKDIELKNATRNFLNFKNFYKGKVLKIKESKCKY